ncbi:MAG TPA: NDP-sugar synthase [Elusimicrobiota bacterium]|nr:NDP-sugar synthase [Elusimicrobiota bacterium]
MAATLRYPVKAMVMAAGAGTRLRPLTHQTPKPMVPILNRPVLLYTLQNLKRHGITEVALNLHNHPDMIRSYFKSGEALGMRLEYSYEPRLLGTAGGVKNVEWFLRGGTFVVMSGDGLTDVDLTDLLEFHRRRRSWATIALKSVDTRFDYGVTLTKAGGRITRFVEKPAWSDIFSNQVNTGIYVFEPSVFSLIPKDREYDFGHQLWPKLLSQGKPIFGYDMRDTYWCDIGNIPEYRRAHQNVLEGEIRLPMPGHPIRRDVYVGDRTLIHRSARLHPPIVIGDRCRIDANAVIGPYTVMGHNVRIRTGAEVSRCTLWNDIVVGEKVRLESCIVSHQTRILGRGASYEGATIVQTAADPATP